MMEKLFIAISLIATIIVISCEQDNTPDLRQPDNTDTILVTDTCIAGDCYTCRLTVAEAELYHQLKRAYQDSCVSCLEEWIMDWQNEYQAESSIPDSLRDVYAVYKEVYSPWDLARMSDSEFGHRIYEGVDYYIIQSTIRYNEDFRGTVYEYQEVKNFRPEIKNENKQGLYLTDKYSAVLDCFTGTSRDVFHETPPMVPPYTVEEPEQRASFLGNYLRFFRGHWGYYWHYETHPEITGIRFNVAHDSAQVEFRLGYQGGEVILGKENGSWHITDHYMTWIE